MGMCVLPTPYSLNTGLVIISGLQLLPGRSLSIYAALQLLVLLAERLAPQSPSSGCGQSSVFPRHILWTTENEISLTDIWKN